MMLNDLEELHELRGQAGRDPAARFARQLRQYGFLARRHFIERFLQRVIAAGRRFDPRAFANDFYRARHYRQTRPGYRTRIALVRQVPILYRLGGWRGRQVILVGVLPIGARPPAVRIKPPPHAADREWSLLEADFEKSNQHGSRYQRARQTFLRRLLQDRRQPKFVRGWIVQERRRQKQAAAARPAGFYAAGQVKAIAKRQTLRQILADPTRSGAEKKWARQQLARLSRGQKRLKALQAGQDQRRPRLRGVPGYDVGHPIGRVPGVQDPRRFRLELAAQNRARPSIARRLGLDPRVYGESEP